MSATACHDPSGCFLNTVTVMGININIGNSSPSF